MNDSIKCVIDQIFLGSTAAKKMFKKRMHATIELVIDQIFLGNIVDE